MAKKGKKYDPPNTSAGDAALQIVRAGVSAVPLIGGPAAELLNALVTPVLDQRRREWMEDIGEGLRQLEEEKGVKLEDLQQNDVFVDTVIQATQLALRNSQSDKREALRNAVLNAALPSAPAQSLQQIFLGFVDTFTVWHLRLLSLAADPVAVTEKVGQKFPDVSMGALAHIVENAFPQLRGHRGFYDQVWKDLFIRGLISTEELHGMMSRSGMHEKRATGMGQQFLAFIESPV